MTDTHAYKRMVQIQKELQQVRQRNGLAFLRNFFKLNVGSGDVDEFYNCPWTVASVFQGLEPLAQQYVLRLLFASEEVSASHLRSAYVCDGELAQSRHALALKALKKLKILVVKKKKKKKKKMVSRLALRPSFKEQLISHLQCKQDELPFGCAEFRGAGKEQLLRKVKGHESDTLSKLHSKADQLAMPTLTSDVAYDNSATASSKTHSQNQQELAAVLMLCFPTADERVHMGLDEYEKPASYYDFMLNTNRLKRWLLLQKKVSYLLQQYSSESSQHGENVRTARAFVNFLFRLQHCPVNWSFDANRWIRPDEDGSQQRESLLNLVDQLGLVCVKKTEGKRHVFVTAVGISAIPMPGQAIASEDRAGIKLVVETNFKVYAYIPAGNHESGKLAAELAFLQQLVNVQYKAPTMYAGELTKEKVTDLVEKNIPVSRILDYFNRHAHECMWMNHAEAGESVLPPNVVDRIELWYREAKPLEAREAQLFVFADLDEFERFTSQYEQREDYEEEHVLWKSQPIPNESHGYRILFAPEHGEEFKRMIKEARNPAPDSDVASAGAQADK